MQYRRMPGVGAPLSVLGFGAMRLPRIPDGRIDRGAATAMVRHAIDAGVNYIDTAYVYHEGESEPFLREALQDGYRERVRLATKLPGWLVECRADMDRYLDEQRARLRTDVIDFYLLHGLNREGWERLQELGVLGFLDDALADGRIRHAGFSFHDDFTAFVPIADAYDWTFCQVQYNYIDVHYQGGAEAVRYAAERGLGVVIMEPLRGGALARPIPGAAEVWAEAGAERTPAEWGLAWLWDQPEVTVVLSGMSTMDQLAENLASADRAPARPCSRRPSGPSTTMSGRCIGTGPRSTARAAATASPARRGSTSPSASPCTTRRSSTAIRPARGRATTSSPGTAGPHRTAPTAAGARSAVRRASRSGGT
jgi:uncharacterized protein